jgi:hypothetical protein
LRKAISIGKPGFAGGVTTNGGKWLITTHLRPPSALITKETGTDFWRVWPQLKEPSVTPTARDVERNRSPLSVSAGTTLPTRVPFGAHKGFDDDGASEDNVAACGKR